MTKKTLKKIPTLYVSQASTWMNCLGSLDFTQHKDIFSDKTQAKLGEKIHAYIEKYLKKMVSVRSGILPLSFEKLKESFFKRDDLGELEDKIKFAYNKIRTDLITYGGQISLEESFQIPLRGFDIKGRADCILRAKGILRIYDFKTSFTPVSAFNNPQLEVTAQHFLNSKPGTVPVYKEITGIIIQTPLQIIDTAEIYFDENYFQNIEDKLNTTDRRLTLGSQCRYCLNSDVCPDFRKNMKLFLNPKYRDVQINRPAEWAEILKISKPIRKALENIESNALTAMRDNFVSIPGFKLSKHSAQRRWNHNIPIPSFAKFLGLKENQVGKITYKSVAEIEKLMVNAKDKFKERFEDIIVKPAYYLLEEIKKGKDFDKDDRFGYKNQKRKKKK